MATKDTSPQAVLAELRSGAAFEAVRTNANSKDACAAAIADLTLLTSYLEAYGRVDGRFELNLSLARGLDYYTGIICEAVFVGNKKSVGSIAGGGRYDNLVGMFSGKEVPSVGFSLGVERIFTILDDRDRAAKRVRRAQHTDVYVVSIGDGLLEERSE